jgi:hypothetical protein
MASFDFRRVAACSLSSLALLALAAGPAAAGTDVFGSGTGGLGSHATSMHSSSYDKSGWGISTMKGYVPPAPEPYESPRLPSASFGASNAGLTALGGNGFGGNALYSSVGSDDFGGSLPRLDQR